MKLNLTIAVVLPDIRSSYNVGSIFRTSDAVGVSSIVLAGHSACPMDKFNRPQKEIAKTALGAEKVIPWMYEVSSKKALRDLKKKGYRIIGVEQTERSINYKEFFKNLLKKDKKERGDEKEKKSHAAKSESKNLAIVFGNEVDGITHDLLRLCDDIVDIPMKGEKESLNVSVSAGIILYELV